METKTDTIGDVVNMSAERERIDIHTALPGRVVSFNPAENTVSVELMINQVMDDGSGSEITVLADVPVQWPRGGGFVITFPIAPGDEGQVIFNERCIDGWWASGEKSVPLDFRLHDYSDATFIAGISSRPKVIRDVFMQGASLQTEDGSTYIRLTPGIIYVKGDIVHEGNTNQTGNYSRHGTSTTYGLISGMGGMSVTGDNGSGVSVTFSGSVEHSGGSITSLGKTIDGSHTHSGVQPGGGNTGAPN